MAWACNSACGVSGGETQKVYESGAQGRRLGVIVRVWWMRVEKTVREEHAEEEKQWAELRGGKEWASTTETERWSRG